MTESQSESEYYQYQRRFGKIVELVSNHVRRQMFANLMRAAAPSDTTRVVDVGVTADKRSDSNFFESMYPYPQNVTAVGLEDASFLEQRHPGLKFVQADALALPFEDKAFDLGVSFAVIEHLGGRQRQAQFVRELSRVCRAFFITTPNRWYPIEFHTVTPFLHWLPPATFRRLLKLLHMPFYASEETLNLLDEQTLLELLPDSVAPVKMHSRLLGPVSNLVIYARDKS